MRIANNINNGNFQAEINNKSLRGTAETEGVIDINKTLDNYLAYKYSNVNNCNVLSTDYTTDTKNTSVCNEQYKLNNLHFLNLENKDTENLTRTLKTESSLGYTNASRNISPSDDIQPYLDISDVEEMSEDSIQAVPRGIVNPNYPGFQHLAHTLQDYSSNLENFYQSDYEMTDDDTDITELDVKSDSNENYTELNNNTTTDIISVKEKIPSNYNTKKELAKQSDIPDLLKTISTNNNNDEINNCDITCFGTDIENNFCARDIIGDFNKEVEDEIKHLLNYNINIQDDLEELRKDIKDNFEKPIENTINNISEVVNHVIKKLVGNEVSDESNESIPLDTQKINEINTINMNKNEVNVRMEINLSRPTFLLLNNDNDPIKDAVLSDGKEEININEVEYDTEKLSSNVENTIKQLSTELRKIIPKINEMRERDRLWADRPIITDGNSNRILARTSNVSNTNKDRNRQLYDRHKVYKSDSFRVTSKTFAAQNDKKTPSKHDAQYKPSVPKNNAVLADNDFESFDVYNIETALPKLDIDTIENYIKAAKEAERRKRNDREEIRKRLAMGVEADEFYSLGHTERPGKKPSLHSRLQNGKNLQICFMNETASDNESQSSDLDRSFSSNTKSLSRSSLFSKSSYNHPYQTRPLSINITRQDKSNTSSGFKFHPASLISKSSKSRSSQSLNHIELKESDFYALQATLQTEARIALAQAKELARIQMEHERRSRAESPVTEMLRRSMEKANVPLAPDRRRVSRQILTDMNIAQLQVIVNELHSQIECLNDTLVKLLMARDELHMGQDSMLVDIEDLTRYLGFKEQNKKSKGTATKSGVKRLTSLVHK